MEEEREVTFFTKSKSYPKKYSAGDLTRREIILCLLRSNKPISKLEVSKRTGINTRIARELVDSFVRAGLAKPVDIAKLAHIQPQVYELTTDGIYLGIGVSRDSKNSQGVDYKLLLQKISQATPTDNVGQVFLKYFTLNAIHLNRLDLLLDVLKEAMKAKELYGSPADSNELRMWMLNRIISNPSEFKQAIQETLANLTENDKLTLGRMLKTILVGTLYRVGMEELNGKKISLAEKSEIEPDVIYLPAVCKCGYKERRVNIMTLMNMTLGLDEGVCHVCKSPFEVGYGAESPESSLEQAKNFAKNMFH